MDAEINDKNSVDISLSVYFRMGWDDPRLKLSSSTGEERVRLPEDSWKKIWIPDVFIRDVKTVGFQDIVTPNRFLSIIPSTGSMFHVMKVTLVSRCRSNPYRYPFDTVVCPLNFESFGYKIDTLTISPLKSPIEVSKSLMLPNFMLMDSQFMDCTENYTSGSYPCLQLSVDFKRVSSFVSQVCIPTIAIVILSWIAFWIERDAAVARLLAGFLSLITLTLVGVKDHASRSRSSAATLVDTWFLVCFTFVFASLLEYLLIVIVSRKRSGAKGFEIFKPSLEMASDGTSSKPANDGSSPAIWIDWISRILFPIAFAVSVLVFWISVASPF